ncbi:uncharacterized protein [Gorilla gorilla gorilla]|uniref:uncharacterized protein n=1 Tax=Gorilla gorilla gorilla TaxID=9595 RepID=UPI003009B99B
MALLLPKPPSPHSALPPYVNRQKEEPSLDGATDSDSVRTLPFPDLLADLWHLLENQRHNRAQRNLPKWEATILALRPRLDGVHGLCPYSSGKTKMGTAGGQTSPQWAPGFLCLPLIFPEACWLTPARRPIQLRERGSQLCPNKPQEWVPSLHPGTAENTEAMSQGTSVQVCGMNEWKTAFNNRAPSNQAGGRPDGSLRQLVCQEPQQVVMPF